MATQTPALAVCARLVPAWVGVARAVGPSGVLVTLRRHMALSCTDTCLVNVCSNWCSAHQSLTVRYTPMWTAHVRSATLVRSSHAALTCRLQSICPAPHCCSFTYYNSNWHPQATTSATASVSLMPHAARWLVHCAPPPTLTASARLATAGAPGMGAPASANQVGRTMRTLFFTGCPYKARVNALQLHESWFPEPAVLMRLMLPTGSPTIAVPALSFPRRL